MERYSVKIFFFKAWISSRKGFRVQDKVGYILSVGKKVYVEFYGEYRLKKEKEMVIEQVPRGKWDRESR